MTISIKTLSPIGSFVMALLIAGTQLSCASKTPKTEAQSALELATKEGRAIPFVTVDHALSIGLKVQGPSGPIEARFILETGLGLNLISKTFCEKIHCIPQTAYSGNRLSGKKVDVPFTQLSAVSFGNITVKNVQTGVFDMTGFSMTYQGVDGFISLAFFGDQPFTIDYEHSFIIFENTKSLNTRENSGTSVPLKIVQDQMATTAYMPIAFASQAPASAKKISEAFRAQAEIDTGSEFTILNEKHIAKFHIKPADLKQIVSKDKSPSNPQRVATLSGTISPSGAPEMKQNNPRVLFQKMIYDGVIGDDFLRRFIVTFDVAHEKMILSKR
jgi:hypothetical protein